MKIRLRITLAMIVLLNASILITGAFVYDRSSRVINDLTENSALELVSVQQSIISGLIDREILLPSYLTYERHVLDLLADQGNPEKADRVNALLKDYVAYKPNLEGIFLANDRGITLGSSNLPTMGLDVSDRDYHVKTVATGKSTVSETLSSKFSGRQIFMVTLPILDPESEKLLGYFSSVVKAESVATQLRDMKLNGARSSYAYLVDEKGNLIFHPDRERIGAPLDIPEILAKLPALRADGNARPGIARYGEDGQDMVSAYVLIPRTGWVLAIVGNLGEFKAPIASMNSFMALFGLLITVLATVAAYFMARQLSLPIIRDLEAKNLDLLALNDEISASRQELRAQVEELGESKKTIVEMAYYDSLTGLSNRRKFIEELDGVISGPDGAERAAVLFLDLDNFKWVNDTMGHTYGDELLVAAGKRLASNVRDSDLIARLGGDEFSVILPRVSSPTDVLPLIKRLLAQFREPFRVKGKTVNQTASIGLSFYPHDGKTVEELLQNADTAMYKAKELGKNTFQFYNFGMKEELLRRTNLERMLRGALENGEFSIEYQPQYRVAERRLRGFEALIRWRSPETGAVSPVEFIPVAEETGLIVQIGAWVFREACLLWKRELEPRDPSLTMAINISAIQLRQKGFLEFVTRTVGELGIPPERVELEVTESLFIGNEESPVQILNALRNMGFGIALDDFGTGYSSLSYLRKLPISLLKIDKSFINEIGASCKGSTLTESIIALVHGLDIEALAEGVENAEQLEYLANSKCDSIQGYHFSKPLPAGRLAEAFEAAGSKARP